LKSCVIYWTKNRIALSLSLLRGSAADNVLRVPKISSNRFTSGGVIPERVNTVETRHKVNPMLGDAIASRLMKIKTLAISLRSADRNDIW